MRQRGLYRSAGICQPWGGAFRGGIGVSGGAGEYLAGGGGEKRRGHALSPAGGGGTAVPAGGGDYPAACGGLRRPQPLVLDADGINALAGHMDEWERRRGRVTVLTPHEGEFLRVGGNLSQGRTAAAEDFARRSEAVVVLKGPGTVVAGPDGRCRVNTTGNCGMAKGGSGDVLSGVVLALLGLGMDAFDACCCAVWLHGRAGDLAAQEKGQWGMTPTDLLERLPQALREVTE